MSKAPTGSIDRPAALRSALRSLVAERGLHATAVSAVAERAGVAAGTLYVHYPSKDALVLAAYVEVKRELAESAVARVDHRRPPGERFEELWMAVHGYLKQDPEQARFLLQIDASPYGSQGAQQQAPEGQNALGEFIAAPDMSPLLLPLPPRVLYDLALGPAVRIAANEEITKEEDLRTVAQACWRAVTVS